MGLIAPMAAFGPVVCSNKEVPFCVDCDRYISPGLVGQNSACPTCGRPLEVGALQERAEALLGEGAEERLPIPWHLKVLAAGVALYLLVRVWQGISWLAN